MPYLDTTDQFNLVLKGSLGDHVCYTGLPEALFKNWERHPKATVITKYPELFTHNKFVKKVEYEYSPQYANELGIPFEIESWHWLVYRPVRAYYQITGNIIDRNEVQPNLYLPRKTKLGHIVMADQAGWPTRRRGPGGNLDKLAIRLLDLGYHVTVIHNPNYTDCFGNKVPREIEHYNLSVNDNYVSIIQILQEAQYFIGYDSGIAHLAGALKIPSILLAGSVPPIVFTHNSAIKVFDTCDKHCHSEKCSYELPCLWNFPDTDQEIVDIIEKGKL